MQARSEISERDYNTPVSGLVIKSLYSLVSRGTERIVATGKVPAGIQSLMKVPHMAGNFSFPVKYGYSLVGEVLSGDKNLDGKLVHVMHPHQDRIIVDASDVFPVPDNIPATRAVFASNMETALNAVWDANISIGDRVLICGFGVIGALTALLAGQIPAVRVCVSETAERRQQLARKLGFEILDSSSNEHNFDIAMNTSGSGNGLQQCIDLTANEGTILEMSWYGDQEIQLHLGGSFHTGRKKIIASQVSLVAQGKRNLYDHKRRKEVVFRLLGNPVFDRLPCEIIPFDNLPELFHKIRAGTYDSFCSMVKYP